MTPRLVIAIDGPAGAGKTTVAGELAAHLHLPHIDTGAMYRAITLKVLSTDTPMDDSCLRRLCEQTVIEVDGARVLVDGEDVTAAIRRPAVTAAVSRIASRAQVRACMVRRQREVIGAEGAVVEGRDIGTVVLPDADLKVFLTAEPAERARRRVSEFEAGDREVGEVLAAIEARDRLDSERPASPLLMADDAVLIDSTGKTVEAIVGEILSLLPRAPLSEGSVEAPKGEGGS